MIPSLAFSIEWFVIGLIVFGLLHWMFEAQKRRCQGVMGSRRATCRPLSHTSTAAARFSAPLLAIASAAVSDRHMTE
jgi:hypothetical protein